jgi:uncharacterized protein
MATRLSISSAPCPLRRSARQPAHALSRLALRPHASRRPAAGYTGKPQPGRFLANAIRILIGFKAFTLFAFLFGAGIAVQTERFERSHSGSSPQLRRFVAWHFLARHFLARRFLVLLIFGLIHLCLIFNGDILTLYAFCGFLLIPLVRMPAMWMAAAGAVLVLSSNFVALPIPLPGAVALRAHAMEATRLYSNGGLAEIAAFRIRETNQLIGPLLGLTLPRTLGVIILGFSAWRSGLFTIRHRWWPRVLALSLFTGAAGISWRNHVAEQLGLAFACATAALLFIRKAPLLAAGGQMALTNYLAQSFVFSAIFYGYGFGLFGRVGVVSAVAGGTAFYLVELVLSRWSLGRFRFGPFEWLWRSLSYARRQPMARGESVVSSAGSRAEPSDLCFGLRRL